MEKPDLNTDSVGPGDIQLRHQSVPFIRVHSNSSLFPPERDVVDMADEATPLVWSVLCVSFSALSLLVLRHPAYKNPVPLSQENSSLEEN